MNTVTIQTVDKLNQPILVFDWSKTIVETVTEQVSELKEGMTVVSEKYNPFFKQTVYVVNRNIQHPTCVGRFFNSFAAVQFAKKYAKQNNLTYTK